MALLCVTAPAIAQTEEESAKERARDHFAKGIALFAEESWDAALTEFTASRALFPTKNATKNAAICLRQLHRFDEALDMFETLLRDFPDLPPDARALVDKEMKNLQSLVGTIELRGGESGAAIVIDNRNRGVMPSKPIRVAVGTHVVRVVKDGFTPFEAQVQVASAQATALEVKLRLLEQAGRLRVVEANGNVINVVIDGVVVGKTPWEGSVTVGDHAVSLDGSESLGSPPTRASVSLNKETSLTLKAELLEARLRIEPNPPVARVTLDGVVIGRGLWEGKVHTGAHRIEIAADEYLPATRDIKVSKGDREVVAIALERDPTTTVTFREARAARQAWLDRRGSTYMLDARAHGIVMVTRSEDVLVGRVVTGSTPERGNYTRDERTLASDFGGGGAGGVGVRAAYVYLALPDPTVGNAWNAVRVGTGIDVNFGYWYTVGSTPTSTEPGNAAFNETVTKHTTGVWGTGWMINVPLTIGYQVGLGSFKGREWTGVALGLAYTPTFSVLFPSTAASTSSFRWAAFEVSIDFLDNPMHANGKRPYGKFFVYTILPSGSEPLIVSIGGGVPWY